MPSQARPVDFDRSSNLSQCLGGSPVSFRWPFRRSDCRPGRLRPKAALERLVSCPRSGHHRVGLPPIWFNSFVTDAAAALGLDFGLYYRVISLREAI